MRVQFSIGWAMVLVACGAPRQAHDAGAPSATPSDDVAQTGPVVATVDGAPITLGEVQELVQATGLSPIEALRRLEEEHVLWARAEASHAGGAEVDDAIRRAAVQALLQAAVERQVTPQSIPEEALHEAMQRSIGRFHRPEQRRCTHLLAELPRNAPPEVDAAAERWIRHAIEQLRAAQDPVQEAHVLAQDVPGRAFRVRAEDLPPVADDGTLMREFTDVLFGSSTLGALDRPVRTRFGWHAIVLREILPPWEVPYAEREATVRDELVVELRARRLDALIDEIAARTAIERNEPAINDAINRPIEEHAGGVEPPDGSP